MRNILGITSVNQNCSCFFFMMIVVPLLWLAYLQIPLLLPIRPWQSTFNSKKFSPSQPFLAMPWGEVVQWRLSASWNKYTTNRFKSSSMAVPLITLCKPASPFTCAYQSRPLPNFLFWLVRENVWCAQASTIRFSLSSKVKKSQWTFMCYHYKAGIWFCVLLGWLPSDLSLRIRHFSFSVYTEKAPGVLARGTMTTRSASSIYPSSLTF